MYVEAELAGHRDFEIVVEVQLASEAAAEQDTASEIAGSCS